MLSQTKWLLCLGGWQILSIFFLVIEGNFHSNTLLSFSLGPNDNLKFLNFTIDTWGKYICFVCWLIIDTIINTTGGLIIYPWITNEVMDKKTIKLSGGFRETIMISTGYEFYSSLRGIFIIYFSFTQIDFLFIKVVLDTLCQFAISRTTIKKKNSLESCEDGINSHLIDIGDPCLSTSDP
jgi:hypothetical protein